MQIRVKVEKLKKQGLVFGYEFEIDKGGEKELWVRIGYEWKRSPQCLFSELEYECVST